MQINPEKINKVELEQSVMRLVMVGIAVVYGLYIASMGVIDKEKIEPVVMLGYVYIFISAFSILHVYLNPEGCKWRHTIYMVCDILVTSIVLHTFDRYGVPYFSLYLWLTVGNGFRYGYKEMISCAFISLIGFIVVLFTTEYWKEQILLSVTASMLLSVIPVYVSLMLKRLQDEKDRAERASAEKSRFIANVSHELRTPLNAIVGFGSMIDRIDVDEQVSMAKSIRDSSMSLMHLVEGVLDMAKIESGQAFPRHQAYQLERVLSEVSGIFTLQAGKKKLRYQCIIDPSLPGYFMGDPQRLEQVLINLVGNSVKFTDQGYISISVLRIKDEAKNERLYFEVLDSGQGFPGESRAKIFDRFWQVDDSIQRRYGGAGLGTTISQHLVRLMGGEIAVDTVYGVGSKFSFDLPLVEASDDDIRELREQMAKEETPLNALPKLTGRVLIVEDSDINCYVYESIFSCLGIDIDMAEGGMVALNKLEREKYDLLVFDMQMPGMSGDEAIERYYQMVPPEDRAPIIVITGDATSEVEKKCEQLQVQAFLTKPVTFEDIHVLMNRFIPTAPVRVAGSVQACPGGGQV